MAIVSIPPLKEGEQLTRDEFLRRWEAEPKIKFAELIGGTVYMPSPVSIEHGYMHRRVGTWLGVYQVFTRGTDGENDATSLLLEDSPQPDLNLRIKPEYGGMSRVEGRYLQGPPEFVAEVCVSTSSYDLHQKFDLYQEAGIPEYLAVVMQEQEIRWHILVDGRYEILPPEADGLWRSRIFPGLWLDGKALLSGDLRQVFDRLQEGLHSPEHERFVAQLAARRKA